MIGKIMRRPETDETRTQSRELDLKTTLSKERMRSGIARVTSEIATGVKVKLGPLLVPIIQDKWRKTKSLSSKCLER